VHTPGAPHTGQSAEDFSAISDEVTCREFVELVTDYFGGALDARTLGQVEEHLVMCDWCVTYAEQLDATVQALGQLAEAMPPDPPDVALAALRERREA
jgi:predicted anti-sigma-YlaC factor YlaD